MEAITHFLRSKVLHFPTWLMGRKVETDSSLPILLPQPQQNFFARALGNLKARVYGEVSKDDTITPEELVPLLNRYHIGTSGNAHRMQTAQYLCREINAMALDREGNRGKVKFVDGEKVTHLFSQFDPKGKLLSEPTKLNIPFKIWLEMNTEGTKVKVTLVPYKNGILGQGGFKTIYRAKEVDLSLKKNTSGRQVKYTPYVVQTFLNPQDSKEDLHVEGGFKIHRDLKELFPTENIVDLSQDISTEGKKVKKMRWYHGDLKAATKGQIPLDIDGRQTAPFVVDDSLKVVADVAKTMEKIHNIALVHLDLRPENILIDLDKRGDVVGKVSDFDLVCGMKKKGSPAPLWYVDRLSEKGWITNFVDVFSLAVSLSNATIPFFNSLKHCVLYEFTNDAEENKFFCLKQIIFSNTLKAIKGPLGKIKEIAKIKEIGDLEFFIARGGKLLSVDAVDAKLNRALDDPEATPEIKNEIMKLMDANDKLYADFVDVIEAYENGRTIPFELQYLVRPLDHLTLSDIEHFLESPFLIVPYNNLEAIRERILTLVVGDALLLHMGQLNEFQRSKPLNNLLKRIEESDPSLKAQEIMDEVQQMGDVWFHSLESSLLKDAFTDIETISSIYYFTSAVFDQADRLDKFFDTHSTAREIFRGKDDQKKLQLMADLSTNLGIFNMLHIRRFVQDLIQKRKNYYQRNTIDNVLKVFSSVLIIGSIAAIAKHIIGKSVFKNWEGLNLRLFSP